MQYAELTDIKAISEAAAKLSACLAQGAQTLEGADAAGLRHLVLAHPQLALWATACTSMLDDAAPWRRAPVPTVCTRWTFGTIPAEAEAPLALDPVCELSLLSKKFKRSRETVFLKDAEGQLWLGHRGVVKEKAETGKQPKDIPLAHDRVFQSQDFPRVGPFGDSKQRVMVIGRIEDEQFLERLAHFVHDFNHYRHGGPTGAERLEELKKSQSWTGRAMSFFKRK